MYCIVNDSGLRWSSTFGWVGEPFDVFNNKEIWNLPDGGRWVDVDDLPRAPRTNHEHKHDLAQRCPFCLCPDVEYGETNYDAGSCMQEASCMNCEAEWKNVYEVVGYDAMQKPLQGFITYSLEESNA